MKVVINTCYGGYGLSIAAYEKLGLIWDNYGFAFEQDRSNPKLVDVVEKLGDKANGSGADLAVVEIPDDTEWVITEYDGREQVEEKHRIWHEAGEQ
jgi:hypothetical protein